MLGKVAKSTRRHWSARRDENSDSVITREWYRTVGVVSSPVASMQRARGPPWDCERGERKGERGVRGQSRVLGAVFPRSALATRTRRAGGYRAQNKGAREAAGRGISRGERGSGRERREAVGARAHPTSWRLSRRPTHRDGLQHAHGEGDCACCCVILDMTNGDEALEQGLVAVELHHAVRWRAKERENAQSRCV
jgi:hypothetical protein